MSSVIQTITHLAAPWASFYDDSKAVSTAVTILHLGGMLLAGGLAISADRSTLRARTRSDRSRHLEELTAVHKPVMIGLAITVVSGLLMLAADLKTFLPSVLFWLKMGAFGALLLNGSLLARAERQLRVGIVEPETGWRRLRITSVASATLWFLALVLGGILPNA